MKMGFKMVIMKTRTEINGSKNDDWATPPHVIAYVRRHFFRGTGHFDPCPLNNDINIFNGLEVDWKEKNFINPPYSRSLKEAFILKAIEQSNKGKLCVVLIPSNTETKLFHELIIPNAEVFLIKGRIKFRVVNTFNEFVTDKTGQTGSMFAVFGNNKRGIHTITDLYY